ncbi:MAG: UDP-N-acetylmuramate dehydrogenase [Sciscionella sp.]
MGRRLPWAPVTSAHLRPGTASLAAFTTLRLGGPADRFVEARDTDTVLDVVRRADAAGERLLVLGGGSNLVVADGGFDGTVVWVATSGFELDFAGDAVTLRVAAGEDWDSVVARSVDSGLGGLECLSGIPGLLGATPVQNVGAYGVEMSDLLISVSLLDRRNGGVREVPAGGLGLGYRSSVLKGTDSAVVLAATFGLRAGGLSMPVRYAELARTLGVQVGDRVPVADARAAVLALRSGKGMVLDAGDHDTWSTGSFFTNPVLDDAALDAVLARIAATVGEDVPVPSYPGGAGRTKLSAAWLIERAGFLRGHPGPGGRVALSTKHTLALTNRGGASTSDLLALAREVRDGVSSAFGVELHPEPVLVNCSL